MKKPSFGKLERILDYHHRWLDPLVVFLIGSCWGLYFFEPSPQFRTDHEILSKIFEETYFILPWALIFLIPVWIFLVINNWRIKPALTKLEKEIESHSDRLALISENIENLFNGQLQKFFHTLIQDQENSNKCRITLYITEEANGFIRCGRYSPNPTFSEPGRPSYPRDEGCIKEGWEYGWHFDNKFPEQPDDIKSRHTNKYKLGSRVASKLNMPSRLYGVLRVVSDDGVNLGVLVFESTITDVVEESFLRDELEKHQDYLAQMIGVLLDYIPKPSTAKDLEL